MNVDKTSDKIAVMSSVKISKAVANEDMSLFLDREGGVWLAGRTPFGLARSNGSENESALYPEPIKLPDGINIADIAIGSHHIALTSSTGAVYLAGRGTFGALGMGDDFYEDVGLPTLLPTKHHIRKASAGYGHTLFLTDTGKVYATGSNTHGVLGIMQQNSHKGLFRPRLVIGLDNKNIVDLVAGSGQSTFFLTADGKVYSCGSGMRSCLGYEMMGYGVLPVILKDLKDEYITQVDSVYHYTAFLTKEGEVYGCGAGFPDPLVEEKQSYQPVKVTRFCEEPIIQVAAGDYKLCYLTAAGHVYMSSKKEGVQLAPKRVENLPEEGRVTSIAAGDDHFIFVMENGCVLTCGKNKHGQLGLGETEGDTDSFNEIPEKIQTFNIERKPLAEAQETLSPSPHNIQTGSDEELFQDIDENEIDMAMLTAINTDQLNLLKEYDPIGSKVRELKDSDGKNALQFAIQFSAEDNIEMLAWLTSKPGGNIPINPIGGGVTPFLRAVKANKLHVMAWLAAHGAKIGAVIQRGDINALHIAASIGSPEILEWLLTQENVNFNINSETARQETPFLIAAASGNLAVLEVLKSHGATLSVTNVEGMNALHIATWHTQNGDLIEWLAAEQGAGLDINSRGGEQRTPFMLAVLKPSAKRSRDQLDLLKRLKQLGADTTLTDEKGLNAVHHAVLESSDPSVLAWLVSDECGSSIESCTENGDGLTPLLLAAARHELELVDTLHAAGADMSAVDKNNNNALLLSMTVLPPTINTPYPGGMLSQRNANIVERLLAKYGNIFDLEHRGQYGFTAFLMAVSEGNIPWLKLLKSLNVNVHVKDDDGDDALSLSEATVFNQELVAYLLSEEGANVDINARNNHDTTAFCGGAERGSLDFIKFLATAGARTDTVDKDGDNALHCAAYAGRAEVVEWLLTTQYCHFAIESLGASGQTALLRAAEQGHKNVLEILQAQGANLKATDIKGRTALHLAAEDNHLDAVKWLSIQAPSLVQERDTEGRTAMDVAQANEHQAIVDCLRSTTLTEKTNVTAFFAGSSVILFPDNDKTARESGTDSDSASSPGLRRKHPRLDKHD